MGQFSGLFKELKTKEKKPTKAKSSEVAQISAESVATETITAPKSKPLKLAKAKTKKPSRPEADAPAPMRGKRSHPDYTQAPAFVRKDTYKAVKIALLNDERGLDYSDLVQELLSKWLETK